jgi:hypothetical protein
MKRIIVLLVVVLTLSGCSIARIYLHRNPFSIEKDGWRVTVEFLNTDEKLLEQIYTKNTITSSELESNYLYFVKIEFTNLSKISQDLSSFRYQLFASSETSKDKVVLVDSEKKGFVIPPETGYFLINKLAKLGPGKSTIGYLPFWIPKDSKYFSLSIMQGREMFDAWLTFYKE